MHAKLTLIAEIDEWASSFGSDTSKAKVDHKNHFRNDIALPKLHCVIAAVQIRNFGYVIIPKIDKNFFYGRKLLDNARRCLLCVTITQSRIQVE